jgi:hypothetical protein
MSEPKLPLSPPSIVTGTSLHSVGSSRGQIASPATLGIYEGSTAYVSFETGSKMLSFPSDENVTWGLRLSSALDTKDSTSVSPSHSQTPNYGSILPAPPSHSLAQSSRSRQLPFVSRICSGVHRGYTSFSQSAEPSLPSKDPSIGM